MATSVHEDSVIAQTSVHHLTLDQLAPGESAVIVDVDARAPMGRRLLDVGIAPGVRARGIRRAPLGDPMEICLPDMLVSLRCYEAALVRVQFN